MAQTPTFASEKNQKAREKQQIQDRIARSDARRNAKLTMEDFKKDYLGSAKLDMAYEVIHRNKTRFFSGRGVQIGRYFILADLEPESNHTNMLRKYFQRETALSRMSRQDSR